MVVHQGVVHSRVADNHSHGVVVDSHGVDDHAGVDSHSQGVVAHSRVVVAHSQGVVAHSQAVVVHSHVVEDDHTHLEVDGHRALQLCSFLTSLVFFALRKSFFFFNICN